MKIIILPLKKIALLAAFLVFAVLKISAQDILLHNANTLTGFTMTWAGGNPEAALEINTDKDFLSEGTGSILARSVVPANSSVTSYVAFRLPVAPMRLEEQVLAFDIWSSEPEHTLAFHVRGLNAQGKIVAGWSSWSHPLNVDGQSMFLIPGWKSGELQWETSRIQAPDDDIVFLEFIAGSRSNGQSYNFYVDNLRTFARNVALHNADTLTGITMTWAGNNPEAALEINTDENFLSEGSGSILAHSVVPTDTSHTSYVAIRMPIAPMRLEGRVLTLDVWSGEPVNTLTFHVRGLNAQGKIVAGWASWFNPLETAGQKMFLIPGWKSGALKWETARIQAPDDDIVFLEIIAGSRSNGQPYNFYVDDIRVMLDDFAATNCIDHGVMAPVGMSTWSEGTVATVDAAGKRIVFNKLWTGNDTSYLFIDAETGETEQIYPQSKGLGAYGVLMTPDNIIYDTMGNQLIAIDVSTRTMRSVGEFASGMALSYTQTAGGVIYAGIYPHATLISYNPVTDHYINHGSLNNESWQQYLRPLMPGSDGWIYGSIGQQAGQVVGFNPATGTKISFIPEGQRRRGQPELFCGVDGQVYAYAEDWGWHRLSEGTAISVGSAPQPEPGTNWNVFPDGSRITKTNFPDRKLSIRDFGTSQDREVYFDYTSTGIPIYTLIAGPGGGIFGATGVPLRVWSYDPLTNETWNSGIGGHGGHINQFVRQGDKLYGAVYSGGQLLEYDPFKPFDDVAMALSLNPRQVHYSPAAADLYGRPNAVLAHPDGRHILAGGKAARVLAGSGMLVYDTLTETGVMLDRNTLLPDHGINAMTALPGGDVLVGTSIHPATGGSPGTATTAMLYRFNMTTHSITNQWPLQPDSPAVRDMVVAADGLVYGLAEPGRFFVFDPAAGEFVHQENMTAYYGNAAGYQAPRCMIVAPDGNIYALFQNAVVCIEPGTFQHRAIAYAPATITTGIAIQDGRIYFACGSRLFSCALNPSAP